MIVQCATCGVDIKRKPYQLKKNKSGVFYCPQHNPFKRNRTVVQCVICGRVISLSLSKAKERKYCSKTCESEGKSEKAQVKCLVCGKDIKRSPSAVRERNYCSPECAGKCVPRVRLECTTCGKELLLKPSKVREKNYCSKECQSEGQINKMRIKCATCGKVFYRIPSAVRERNYCSQECSNQARSGQIITSIQVECATCGEVFYRKLSEIKEKNYCSQECYLKDYSSNIETIVEQHLQLWGFKEGLDYFPQKHFQSGRDYPEGNFGMRPDFYFPQLNTVIECNGTYWHADPVQYSDRSELNSTQKRLVQRYERKVRYYHSRGINLIELWERDNRRFKQQVILPLAEMACSNPQDFWKTH